jgi:hypothetical protein
MYLPLPSHVNTKISECGGGSPARSFLQITNSAISPRVPGGPRLRHPEAKVRRRSVEHF